MWLETDNYINTVKEKEILLSDIEWLNNSIMDVVQKLICKALGSLESHQSVLNWQKRGTPFSVLVRSMFNLRTTVQAIGLFHLALPTMYESDPGYQKIFKSSLQG